MSLRNLARAAPRTASRIVSSTPKSSFIRPSLHTTLQTLRPQQPQLSSLRAFSTSHKLRDDASQELAAKLSSEYALETEDSATPASSDENIQTFLSQNPHWNLHDLDHNQEVLLTRTYEDEEITVSFSPVDFNTPMEMNEGEEMDEAVMDDEDISAQSGGANTKGAINQGKTSGGNFKVAPQDSIAPADREELRSEEEMEGQENEDDQPAFPANVNVLIQRKGKGALRINLIADTGMFNIQSLTHVPDSKHTNGLSASELIRLDTPNLYTGPPFQQLDEEVQSLLEQYLDVRGINTHLALFVPEYIDVKEQKEYLGWLGRVRGFVE
ncbi:Mitochondrial acidic protein mam33 [Recurvomyces mirabilis]|nr:Mitochondrial acidic protein mam33 [Recurvomyces mirabilis]